jgi:phenylacetic acid degradation operon negative regulatory protein
MKMQRMRVSYVGEVLLVTIATAGIIGLAVCAPNALQLLKPFFKKKKYSPKQAIQRNIESLVRTGLVSKRVNTQGKIVLELTRRGKWEAMLRAQKDIDDKKKWDKKWRFVIFDVPNTKSNLRAELTRGMKLYGFHQLQKSIWIYPYPCDDFVTVLRDHLELLDHVLYVTTDSFRGDKKVKKYFKL